MRSENAALRLAVLSGALLLNETEWIESADEKAERLRLISLSVKLDDITTSLFRHNPTALERKVNARQWDGLGAQIVDWLREAEPKVNRLDGSDRTRIDTLANAIDEARGRKVHQRLAHVHR